MAHDVFISYSTSDKPTADAVCAGLESRGVRCWIAPRDVLPSTDWGTAIIDAITHSQLMVLVYSSNTNNSQQVKRELERAVSKGVPILPFRIEDVPVSQSLEWYLSLPHWLDAFTPPLEQHINYLAGTVRVLLERASEAPTEGAAQSPRTLIGDAPATPPIVEIPPEPSYAPPPISEAPLAPPPGPPAASAVASDASAASGNASPEASAPTANAEVRKAAEPPLAPARQLLTQYRALAVVGAVALVLLVWVLLVQRSATTAAQPLELGQSTFGVLTPRASSQRYRLNLTSGGGTLRVELTNLPKDYDLYVTGPNGRSEFSLKSALDDDVVTMSSAIAGDYEIEVKAHSETSGEPYRLVARLVTADTAATPFPTSALGFLFPTTAVTTPTSAPFNFSEMWARLGCAPPTGSATPIQLGQTGTGTLTSSERQHIWTLNLSSPIDLRVLLGDLTVDYDLTVYLPDGRCQSSTRAGSADDVVEINGAAPGEYRIDVRALSEVSPQPYRLSISRF